MFRVGQKVECVDAVNPCRCGCNIGLTQGAIYTISKTFVLHGLPGVFVAEASGTWTRGYRADRFRPIVERNTDISIFTEMLASTQGAAKCQLKRIELITLRQRRN